MILDHDDVSRLAAARAIRAAGGDPFTARARALTNGDAWGVLIVDREIAEILGEARLLASIDQRLARLVDFLGYCESYFAPS